MLEFLKKKSTLALIVTFIQILVSASLFRRNMKNLSLNEKKYKALQGTIPEKIIGIKQTNKNSSKIEEDPQKL